MGDDVTEGAMYWGNKRQDQTSCKSAKSCNCKIKHLSEQRDPEQPVVFGSSADLAVIADSWQIG